MIDFFGGSVGDHASPQQRHSQCVDAIRTTVDFHDVQAERHVNMLVSTENYPINERFAAWVDLVSHALIPVHVDVADPAAYQGRMLAGQFGQVSVAAVSSSSYTCRRTSRLISKSDPHAVQLMLVTQGIAGVRQNNSESLLRPGDLAILTSWRPFTVRTTADDTGLVAGTTAVIPRHHIPLPTNTLERLAAHTIVGHDGSGALLASLLIGLTQQPPTPPADAMRLVSALVDLLTVSLNAAADLHPVDTVHRALFTTVRTFIQQRLADLDLTPSTVAAAHHVSTRTLNRLFEHHGDTVAEFIRRSRLDRCIRDLAEPTLRHHPVQEIATRWGFRSPTHFNRRFQSITGMTPSQYRRSQLDSNAPAASG